MSLQDVLASLGTSTCSNPRDAQHPDDEAHDFDTYPQECVDALMRYADDPALDPTLTLSVTPDEARRIITALRVARDTQFDRTDPGWRIYTDLMHGIEEAL